jgi:anti-anti-sigma regulatory factor
MPCESKFIKKSKTLSISVPEKFNDAVFQEFKHCYESNLLDPAIYQVDLKKTDEINSTGLVLLLSLFYYAKDRGKNVQLINTKPQVKQFLIENQYSEIIKLG